MNIQQKEIDIMEQSRLTLSASTLIGDKVLNPNKEELGTVKDIMLDTKTGKVAYVVVSYGGFLGMGDKLFAIPFASCSVDEKNKALRIDVSEEVLKTAPGFDKDHWPDFSNPKFNESIESHYRQR